MCYESWILFTPLPFCCCHKRSSTWFLCYSIEYFPTLFIIEISFFFRFRLSKVFLQRLFMVSFISSKSSYDGISPLGRTQQFYRIAIDFMTLKVHWISSIMCLWYIQMHIYHKFMPKESCNYVYSMALNNNREITNWLRIFLLLRKENILTVYTVYI